MGTATNSPPSLAEKQLLSLKRIGWLYPIFRDPHFYHALLGTIFLVRKLPNHRRIFTTEGSRRVPCYVKKNTAGRSSNGRTRAFGAWNGGSNPPRPASLDFPPHASDRG